MNQIITLEILFGLSLGGLIFATIVLGYVLSNLWHAVTSMKAKVSGVRFSDIGVQAICLFSAVIMFIVLGCITMYSFKAIKTELTSTPKNQTQIVKLINKNNNLI